jgi:hypothetical protein
MVRMSLNGAFYFLLALVSLQAVLPSVAHAQQTISTYTVGPIYGNDSSIAVTTSGTIDGTVSGTGVISTGTNTTTTLINAGAILGSSYGILNEATGSFGTITNSGTISGDNGVYTTGTIGTVINTSTGLISGGSLGFLQRGGSVEQFSNAGAITSDGYAVGFDTGATLGSLTNSGTMIGADQGLILAVTGTVRNLSGAVISGAASDGLDTFGNVELVDNAGSIYGLYRGVFIAAGSVTDLTNTGSIDSGDAGLVMDTSTTLGTLTNSGTISGGGSGAVLSTTGTVTNNAGGSIRGDNGDGLGLGTIGNIGLIDNAGSIYGGDSGVYIAAGSVGVLDNGGTIDGGTAGLQIVAGTTLGRLTNSGTIGGILNEGTMGDVSGPAISSTGTVASIGSIVNTGTINQGVQIENQNVSVSAGVGTGVFDGGTLDVVDGDLTFTDGTIGLNADVSVNGGSGTLINQAILSVTGTHLVTGNFQQTLGRTTLVDLTDVTPGVSFTVTGLASFTGGSDDNGYTQRSGGLASYGSLELIGMSSTAPSTDDPVTDRFIIEGDSITRQSTLTVGPGGLVLDGSNLLLQLGSTTGALGSRLVLDGDVTTAGNAASSIAAPTGETSTIGTRAVELSGTAGAATRTFTIGGDGANLTVSLPITNGSATTAGMLKAGAGTLTLDDANTYSGATTIFAGTLALGANGTIGSSTRITVGSDGSSGAVLDLTAKTGTFAFMSSQTVGGIGTIAMNAGDTAEFAGTLAPGNSPGIITFDGGTGLLSGTTQIEIFGAARGTGYDAIDLINSASLDYGNGVLALDFGTWLADQQSYQLFGSGSSSLLGNFDSVTIEGTNYTGLTFTFSSGVWTSQGTSFSGQTLTFTEATGALLIVPEPAAIAQAGLGIAAAAYALRRRGGRRVDRAQNPS